MCSPSTYKTPPLFIELYFPIKSNCYGELDNETINNINKLTETFEEIRFNPKNNNLEYLNEYKYDFNSDYYIKGERHCLTKYINAYILISFRHYVKFDFVGDVSFHTQYSILEHDNRFCYLNWTQDKIAKELKTNEEFIDNQLIENVENINCFNRFRNIILQQDSITLIN